ncbi:hypothetical protein OF122_14575 [Pelagibacterium flavum]|uniref:Uncharacterized protein n=1 Tax=Pelagibacterium flavum TaxID=2984530 RepID=A0ABY6IP73_9HYPH|nr:hypothetical protein [Pelagibacterium sp. YIM 151497]UYQ71262.1 hypothetical protein OF122_14575 [Pelagibacterium sp. YIM 151497]
MKPKNEKLGTHATQWRWAYLDKRFYMKRDPEIAVSRLMFNQSYFLWECPDEADPASVIEGRFELQIERRGFYPDKPAGMITVEGQRVLNVPITRAERNKKLWEARREKVAKAA